MFFDFMSGLILRRGTKVGSFEAIRITLCEFPHWLRTRKGLRLIPLCYPKHDEMEEPKVTVSNITSALLKVWFPQGGCSPAWPLGRMV